MLLILFGLPGAGKSFVGRLLRDHFNYYFYDADDDLTDDMRQSIKLKKVFTQEMRNRFYQIVAEKIQSLQARHLNIVIAQTLAKEMNRKQILLAHPHARFIMINTNQTTIKQRLTERNDWVTEEYADRITQVFEPAEISHETLDNNMDKQHTLQQLKILLG